jgi:hypothetical protein
MVTQPKRRVAKRLLTKLPPTFLGKALRGELKSEMSKLSREILTQMLAAEADEFKNVNLPMNVISKLADATKPSTSRDKFGLATKLLPEVSIKLGENSGEVTNSAHAYTFRRPIKGMRNDMSYVATYQQEGFAESALDGQGITEYPLITTGLSTPNNIATAGQFPMIKMTTNHIQTALPVPANSIQNADQTQRFYLEKIENELQLKNNSTHRVLLTIYECIPRNNLDYGVGSQAVTVNNQCFIGNSSGVNEASALLAWRVGTDSGFSTNPIAGTPITPNVLGARPTQSLAFNLNWKITGIRKVEMDSNGTHIHRSVYRPNFMLFDPVSRIFDQIAGVTPTLMIQVQGLYGSAPGKDGYASSKVSFGGVSRVYAYAPVGTQGITEFYDPS